MERKKSYKLKQKMINRWIQFGTIGDTLPRREAERERVIDEIDENSGNGKLLTGILNDTNTILNNYDKDFMKEIGDLAADISCIGKNVKHQDTEMEVSVSGRVGDADENDVVEFTDNQKIGDIRNEGSEISVGKVLDDMLGEVGAFEPGGAVDIAVGEICVPLENDGALGVPDGSGIAEISGIEEQINGEVLNGASSS